MMMYKEKAVLCLSFAVRKWLAVEVLHISAGSYKPLLSVKTGWFYWFFLLKLNVSERQ